MNVLMVGPDSLEKGGIATVIRNFEKHYDSSMYSLFFLSSWSSNKKWRTIGKAFWRIRKLIRVNNISIVHFHVAQRGSFFRKVLLSRFIPRECKIIFHMHASQFDRFYEGSNKFTQFIIRRSFDYADRIIVLGNGWADFYKKLTKTEVIVLPNAVKIPETTLFNPTAQNIITFGRVGCRKGSYDLLQVAQQINKSYPDIRFILYGDGEIEKVGEQIKAKRMRNVCLGGWLDKREQKEVIKNAILHFLPSYHEGLPMSVLETMAAGIPNLVTEVGGLPECIVHQKNGLIVKPGDVNGMVRELEDYLAQPKYRKRLSEVSRKYVADYFSLTNYHQKWDEIYTELYLRH
ncbi:glycosyltransferase family 4 protein [Listeria booriae]|uniref:glycosyltransferase family 4 protein n=1 Tax=Listeria booriae TaxID=1552123 RepID=UPI0016288F7D|nr:glycosyltransferase family 4 protein [Listeria booriae]MBC1576053.1 glycosyltransferase family 4 protein [Listeria booriae]